jgi:hypothetical protein
MDVGHALSIDSTQVIRADGAVEPLAGMMDRCRPLPKRKREEQRHRIACPRVFVFRTLSRPHDPSSEWADGQSLPNQLANIFGQDHWASPAFCGRRGALADVFAVSAFFTVSRGRQKGVNGVRGAFLHTKAYDISIIIDPAGNEQK